MELWVMIGGISGIASIVGFFGMLIKIGEWKAQIESLSGGVKKNDTKIEALAMMQHQQNVLLAEIKVKLDLLIEHKRKTRHDK